MTPEEIAALQEEIAILKAKLATMHEDAELDALRTERDALKTRLASVENAGTDALKARDALTAETDALKTRADALTAEKATLTDALAAVTAERDAMMAERDRTKQRADFTRDALVAGLDADYLDVVTAQREAAPKSTTTKDFLDALKASKPKLFAVAAPAPSDNLDIGNPARVAPIADPPVKTDGLKMTADELVKLRESDPAEYDRVYKRRLRGST